MWTALAAAPRGGGRRRLGVKDERLRLRSLLLDCGQRQVPDLARSAFMVATGKLQTSPFSVEALRELRTEWFSLLQDPGKAAIVPDYQPFYLHAMSQSLELGDPDFEVLDRSEDCFATGVPVGHGVGLPHVPQVYRRKLKCRKYDESEFCQEMANYGDSEVVRETLQAQFEAEERENRMFPLSQKEVELRYPGLALRVAAQGVVPKSNGTFRVTHDATHGVRVNNEIRNENRLEIPGPGDISQVLRQAQLGDERIVFSIVGDVEKAHRQFRHRESDWGLLEN